MRLHAGSTLNTDYDELVYMPIAVDYANFLREGDIKGMVLYLDNLEHPALQKVLYGLVLLTQDPLKEIYPQDLSELSPQYQVDAKPWLPTLRQFSALVSAVGIFFLGLLHPVAAVFLGIHTAAVRHTSLGYLETLPTMCIEVSFFCSVKMNKLVGLDRQKWFWLIGSAIFLAGAVGTKYAYALPGVTIALGWIYHFWSKNKEVGKRFIPPIIAVLVTIICLFLLDPSLRVDPLARFRESLIFYFTDTESHNAASAALPWWHALYVLITSVPVNYPALSSSFFVQIDPFISILALVGLVRTARREPFVFLWAVLCLVFLIGWPTRWDQHMLIMLPALCICAANGFGWIYDFLVNWLRHNEKL